MKLLPLVGLWALHAFVGTSIDVSTYTGAYTGQKVVEEGIFHRRVDLEKGKCKRTSFFKSCRLKSHCKVDPHNPCQGTCICDEKLINECMCVKKDVRQLLKTEYLAEEKKLSDKVEKYRLEMDTRTRRCEEGKEKLFLDAKESRDSAQEDILERILSKNGKILCAKEWDECTCFGPVRYGHGTDWITKDATGTILCENSVFGDPKRGTIKECYCEVQMTELFTTMREIGRDITDTKEKLQALHRNEKSKPIDFKMVQERLDALRSKEKEQKTKMFQEVAPSPYLRGRLSAWITAHKNVQYFDMLKVTGKDTKSCEWYQENNICERERGGSCIDVDTDSCIGKVYAHKCTGPSSVRCCAQHRTDSSDNIVGFVETVQQLRDLKHNYKFIVDEMDSAIASLGEEDSKIKGMISNTVRHTFDRLVKEGKVVKALILMKDRKLLAKMKKLFAPIGKFLAPENGKSKFLIRETNVVDLNTGALVNSDESSLIETGDISPTISKKDFDAFRRFAIGRCGGLNAWDVFNGFQLQASRNQFKVNCGDWYQSNIQTPNLCKCLSYLGQPENKNERVHFKDFYQRGWDRIDLFAENGIIKWEWQWDRYPSSKIWTRRRRRRLLAGGRRADGSGRL